MKKYLLLILLLTILLGCTSEGDIKVINRTHYPLYLTVKGNDFVVDGSEDPVNSPTKKTISIETGKEFLFWNGDDKKVKIQLVGETFMLQEADLNGNPIGEYFTETTVLVTPDETTKVYCDPTHAGVKVFNMIDNNIIELNVKRNGGNFIPLTTNTGSSADSLWVIAPGDSVWARLDASTEDYPIFYEFQVVTESYQFFEFPAGELAKDEQFRLIFYY